MMISTLLAAPYAGYIVSAYGLAALIIAGLIMRAYFARHEQIKALHALEQVQNDPSPKAATFQSLPD